MNNKYTAINLKNISLKHVEKNILLPRNLVFHQYDDEWPCIPIFGHNKPLPTYSWHKTVTTQCIKAAYKTARLRGAISLANKCSNLCHHTTTAWNFHNLYI